MRAWTAVKTAGLAAALVLGSLGAASAEPGAVIESSAATYPVGTSIADGETISLGDGENLSLLTMSSRFVELAGPFEGPIPAAGNSGNSNLVASLQRAVFQTDDGSPEIGGVRPLQILTPDMVVPSTVADAENGGNTCVNEGALFGLHRSIPADSEGDWTYGDLTSVDSGQSVQVRWASLEYNVAWPDELPYSDGEEFTIQMAGQATPVNFQVHVLPESETPGERITWMAQHGCTAQIRGVAAQLQSS